jgi:hypothetical protein
MATGHHTKDKGDLAVAKVQADLVERGGTVLQPFTEHAPFDLVAYVDEAFYRVQVKYRTMKGGSVSVPFKTSWADRHGVHTRPMPMNEVDVVAIYCPDTRETYYIDPRTFRGSATVRIEPSKNNQAFRVVRAADCAVFPPPHVRGARALGPLVSDAA